VDARFALVAAGGADAPFKRMLLSEWDVAAGAALIIAAGGRITDAQGCELCFNRSLVTVVASNGLLHDELERLVPCQRAGAIGFSTQPRSHRAYMTEWQIGAQEAKLSALPPRRPLFSERKRALTSIFGALQPIV